MNLARSIELFTQYHASDANLVHGKPLNVVGVTGIPRAGSYNLMTPTPNEISTFTSTDIETITDGCMDIRQSKQLYQAVGGDGRKNVVVLKAGGGATGVEDRTRFMIDVNFHVQAWKASSAHPLIQLLAHDEGCAWAKQMVEPEIVYQWQQSNTEQENMMSRVQLMRAGIMSHFKFAFHKPSIEIGLVQLSGNEYQNIVWQR